MEKLKNKGDDTTGDFYGLPTGIIENQFLRLEYLLTAGPRIVRFSCRQGANLFAELPHVSASTNLGIYHFRGGHRLWRSPELIPESYAPDNEKIVVEQIRNGVSLAQWVENGITKIIDISMAENRAAVTLDHHLRNDSPQPVEIAAWPITMFRLGGVGIFPQNHVKSDTFGLLPNRQLVLWPYTRIKDPRLVFEDDYILLRPIPAQQPLKIGYKSSHGWMGYYLDDILFIKSFSMQVEKTYPDFGVNCEFYCNHQVIELETLSPLYRLKSGEELIHTETWQVYKNLDPRYIPEHLVPRIKEMLRPLKEE